ncbi:NtaA/DmoA family FMN-dependent monooxygenase [Rathayibacter sp. VKM Ac-2803]|uniref:NtaA/DmoA family FMN-dependent monooxygenase n=1 Tax=unclassified Rathayibacter TaxID=2609250 RepID=UPI0013599E1C|nr:MULTISPECIES: NtaA/DmoA family FMN-dependent monooxygenase [unclassified Rathayibacter]MWV48277.1 NtaA/DmoA family FMN-dependent monooxygenase [Rathayibacter sp. VKM Ac-2803]MWV59230.1 NtaA/DmoA family FMN-dependent monooxygenase [Rathayibacter sp. VKM Ac-2754]
MSAKPFHLAWFGAGGFGVKSWNRTWSGRGGVDWASPQLWVDTAQALERARFDYIIIEDSNYVPDAYGGDSKAYLSSATATPKMDPSVLAPIMSHLTSHIGVVPTLSITEYHPYMLARKINTLDHMSQGRTGWNVVTSSSHRGAQNYGKDLLEEHDLRYDMADEFFDLACQLWESWDEDAVVVDEENGVWADFEKVHTLDFEGKFYRSRGPLNAPRSPQGRPVFTQAGGSPRGKRFAARTANSVISGVEGGPEAMKTFREDIRREAVVAGRNPDDVKVLFMVSPVLGETDAEAHEKSARQKAFAQAHPELGLLHLSRHSGIDFAQFPIDEPIPATATTNGHQQMLAQAIGKTPREFLTKGTGSLELVGTPATVAAQMDEVMQEVGGDGFLIANFDLNRRYVSEIADGLVPALQRRGLTRTEYSFDTFRDNLLEF